MKYLPDPLIIMYITFGLEVLIIVYCSFRNDWVYKVRTELLEKDEKKFDELPTHNTMITGHGFWWWDIHKYLKKDKK